MMKPATFYRLKPEKYWTREELLEDLQSLAERTLKGFIVGEKEEKLYSLHLSDQVLCQQTYDALFSLYRLIESRIRTQIVQMAIDGPSIESEAPYALFGKGTTAFFISSLTERLYRLERIEQKMRCRLKGYQGGVYERKGMEIQVGELEIVPISFKTACAFVDLYHRHHKRPQGHLFAIACMMGKSVEGVAMVGRPVSRVLDDGFTAEVNRLCSRGEKNVCSKLYAHSWQAAKALGYRRLITYILGSEKGTSLIAAGWRLDTTTEGGSWDTPSRRRKDKAPTEPKKRYVIQLFD